MPRSQPDQLQAQLHPVVEGVVMAAGFDLEEIDVRPAGRRSLVRVVVDSDTGVGLDDIATLSRRIAAGLDLRDEVLGGPYTLEVTSPGVDRPLTAPRHWRRARGRLVRVKVKGAGEPSTVSGEGFVEGRLLAADADGVTLGTVLNGRASGERRFSYAELGAGSVQVEFGRIPDAELDDFSDPERDDAVFENDTDLGAGGDGP